MSEARLNKLIASLTHHEKRYFKQYLNRYSKSNEQSNYALVFDCISKLPDATSADIIRKCEIKPKQVQNLKSRLYSYILESLRAYNSNKSQEIIIHEQLINYRILMDKGLYQQSLKLLENLERQCLKLESFDFLDEILNRQIYLINTRLKGGKTKEKLDRIRGVQEYILGVRPLKSRLKLLLDECYERFKEEGRFVRDPAVMHEVIGKLKNVQDEVESFPNSFQVQYYFHYCSAIAYREIGHIQASVTHVRKVLKWFELHEYLQGHYKQLYQNALNLSVISFNISDNFDASQQQIERIRAISAQNIYDKHAELQAFENAEFQELELLLITRQYHQAAKKVDRIEKNLKVYEREIHSVNQQSKFYRIALTHFLNNEPRKALRWINRIINFEEGKFRKDILASVRLLNLLIHFDLENYELLEYRISNTKEFLKKIDRYLDVESNLLSTLHRAVKNPKNRIQLLQEFKSSLGVLESINPLDRYALAYYNLKDWAEERID